MDYGLKGKVAVVTGTASQVGMGNRNPWIKKPLSI